MGEDGDAFTILDYVEEADCGCPHQKEIAAAIDILRDVEWRAVGGKKHRGGVDDGKSRIDRIGESLDEDSRRALAGLTTTVSECAENVDHPDGAPCASRKVVEVIASFAGAAATPEVAPAASALLPSAETPEAEAVRKAAAALGCTSESCVIAHPTLQRYAAETNIISPSELKKELDRSFKAAGPRDSLALLSNYNIDETLQRWARVFPGFFPCPFAMIDFDKNGDLFGSVRLSDVIAGNTPVDLGPAAGKVRRKCDTFGCVVNTDPSHLGGHHWFAMFVDCRGEPWTVEYFNSVGSPPQKQIVVWQERTRADLAAFAPNKKVITVIATDRDHQDSQTECGLYSLYYIRRRLEGKPYTFFSEQLIPDDAMSVFRQHVFRKT